MAEDKNGTNGFCCGCCLGLAVGYLIWHGVGKTESTNKNKNQGDTSSNIVQIVEDNSTKEFLLSQIGNYQINISPKIKERLNIDRLCKYEPSCSEYAKEAIEENGSFKGSLIAMERLARCNPFSKGGNDPLDKT